MFEFFDSYIGRLFGYSLGIIGVIIAIIAGVIYLIKR